MSAEHGPGGSDPVEDLLASIADDTHADWGAAERNADPLSRARVDSLRAVARIAEFSRAHQRADAAAPPLERWGEMWLLERLSANERAEVYRAWDPRLQREVALKLVRSSAGDDALLDEARVAARVRHPHVVTVHGVERHDDRVGLWMELVRGASLEHEVRVRGPFTLAEARRIGLEIGSALAALHAEGLLHRDVKPANVVRDATGRWVLTDFGLGIRGDAAAAARGRSSGTPMYMAPEVLGGAPASERSDLYGLGMLVWFALAGRHPFSARTLADLAAAAAAGPDPSLRAIRAGVPPTLVTLVERAVAPRPEDRVASVRAFVEALEAWRPGRPAWIRTLVAAGAVVAIAAGIAFTLRATRREPAPAAVATAPVETPPAPYAIEASFLRRGRAEAERLVPGDRLRPGDRLSLELRTTRPAWVYVLNEDEAGERYVLFPHPRLATQNPLPADSTLVLPGRLDAAEFAWTVTSAGGREHFLVVASPEPVLEIEADLDRIPAAERGRPIAYPTIGDASLEVLRGVGGMVRLPADAARPTPPARSFERFKSLAQRETAVEGVWVRQIVFENPRR